MKRLILIALTIASCNGSTTPFVYGDYIIASDHTDPQRLQPDAESFLAKFNLANNKTREIFVRYLSISDKKTIPISILHLPSEEVTEERNINDLPLYREKTILQFIDSFKKTLSASAQDTAKKDYSEIFATIAQQLSELANRKALHKEMYLYSDLQERSSLFDCYSKKSQKLLQENPGSVVQLFQSQGLLPKNLPGITLHIIYEPKNRVEDDRFIRIEHVYEALLKPLGVQIKVQVQNKFIDE